MLLTIRIILTVLTAALLLVNVFCEKTNGKDVTPYQVRSLWVAFFTCAIWILWS